MPEPKRTEERELAAQLIAAGELTDPEIAERVGVARQTLWGWRRESEFAARVDEVRGEIRESLSRRAISLVERRVASLNSRWLKLNQVIAERAADPTMMKAPGGTSGLLAHTLKTVGSGPLAMVVDEYAVDGTLLKELRELEKQAAQELGQWTAKHEHTGPGGGPVQIQVYLPDNGRDPQAEQQSSGDVAGEPG